MAPRRFPYRVRVGRFLLDGPVSEHTRATGEVVLSGLGSHETLDGALAFREQFVRLAENPDEPVVPIVVPDGWTGYGAVIAAAVEPVAMRDGYQRWTVSVLPVRNSLGPTIESALLAYLRTNDNGATSTWVHAVPAAAESYSWVPGTSSATVATRATDPFSPAAGDVLYRQVAGGNGETLAYWKVAPGSYYAGCCYAEQQSGPTWVPVVGRGSVPETGWRIGNGLVRATIEGALVTLAWYRNDGLGWATPQRWNLRRTNVPSAVNWTSFTGFEITELSAHRVTVRANSEAVDGRATIWLSLRRGSRTVAVFVDSDVVDPHPAFVPVPGIPATDNTFYAVSDPITGQNGLRWIYTAASDFSVVAANGTCMPAVHQARWPFGIGAWLTGDPGNTAITAREWYSPIAERIVFR